MGFQIAETIFWNASVAGSRFPEGGAVLPVGLHSLLLRLSLNHFGQL
jgi:hypothetical protein